MILAERQNAIVNFLAERGFSNSAKSRLIVILETSKIWRDSATLPKDGLKSQLTLAAGLQASKVPV